MSWTIKIGDSIVIKDSSVQELYEISSTEQWTNEILSFLKDWFSTSSEIEHYSSGSTGKPKRMSYSKALMRNSALRTLDFFNINKSEEALLCLPANYIAGKMMLVRAIVGGLTINCIEPKASPLSAVQENYSLLAMTPMQVAESLNSDLFKENRVEHLIIGGAPLSSEIAARLINLDIDAYESFGMTETCSHIALKKLGSDNFNALDGVRFSQGIEGNLVIEDKLLGLEKLETNDIVDLIDSQTFRWLGRRDWVVNSAGIKLHPEMIEAKMDSEMKLPFFLTGMSDSRLGEQLVCVYESEEELSPEFIQGLIRPLEKYERPKKFLRVSKFSRLASGKLDRKSSLNNAL